MLAQFAKVALSVFVVRAVTKLFQTGAASQQAYVRAENLWTHGRLQEVLHGGNASGSAIVTHASYGHRIPGFSRNWVRFVK